MKVLIIDDDALFRMACLKVLRKSGHTVIEAENGQTGVASYKTEKPDLVITDIVMPHQEGLETIAQIRKIDPAAKIIAMSSGGSMKDINLLKFAEKFGANGVLKKPFTPSELLEATDMLMTAGETPVSP